MFVLHDNTGRRGSANTFASRRRSAAEGFTGRTESLEIEQAALQTVLYQLVPGKARATPVGCCGPSARIQRLSRVADKRLRSRSPNPMRRKAHPLEPRRDLITKPCATSEPTVASLSTASVRRAADLIVNETLRANRLFLKASVSRRKWPSGFPPSKLRASA